MTIWLLGLVLLASVAALGYRQGAIRVGISFIGILLGALLAPWLGRVLKPVLTAVGLKNPLLIWILGPLIVFVIISAIFKVAALNVHQKVDVFYKYRAGDLRLALWERLNHRLGLCLGLLNGTAYLVLISFIIYAYSYWTFQTATSETDPKLVRILNRLGEDLQNTGFNKVGHSIDRLPESFYDTADVAGIIYNNSLLEARLARYPGLLNLAEKPEFQDLANDKEFAEMRQRREPLNAIMNYGKIQAIINNPDLLKAIWAAVIPDLKDLRNYLETGRSAKYDPEPLLGRWNFDIRAAVAAYRRTKPNLPSSEMQKVRRAFEAAFAKTTMVAMPDGTALFKNLSQLKLVVSAAPPTAPPNVQGHWKKSDGKYEFSIAAGGTSAEAPATLQGDRLMINLGEGSELPFIKED